MPYDDWTWEQYRAVMKRIARLDDVGGRAGRIYGGVLNTDTNALRGLVWNFDGYFFADHGTDFGHPTFDSPPVQAALNMIYRTRFVDHSVYNAAGIGKDPGQMFIGGKIGCIRPLGRWVVPIYRGITNFKWDVVTVPYAAGIKPLAAVGVTA